jgi:NRAMP (natural resistance-associated macrophage protein)-like metal ion transporter
MSLILATHHLDLSRRIIERTRDSTRVTVRKRALRHHTPRRHRIIGHGYFSRLGPGIVTGAADDDPSGIATYSQVGAAFGFGLLWSTVLVAPMAAAVQENAARLGLATGKGLATLIREHFPRPVLYGALALTIGANTFNIAADVGSMAASTRLVVDLPAALLVVAFTIGMVALAILLPYHRYARVLRWLALSLLAYPLVLLTVDVDWGAVLEQLLHPQLIGGAAGLAALIAVFGTTVSPYLFFWQASEEVEEEIEHHDIGHRLTEDHVRAMRVDVIGGMTSAVAIAFIIIVVAASTLNPAGITTVATAEQAAAALRPLAGDLSGLIFAVGIVGLGLLAVPVLAGSTAYAFSEAFGWHEGLSKTFREARGFYGVLGGSMLAGLLIDVFAIDSIRALYYAAILNGLAAPPLIVLMLILGRDARVVGEHRSGRLSLVIVGFTIVASIAAPIAYLVTA